MAAYRTGFDRSTALQIWKTGLFRNERSGFDGAVWPAIRQQFSLVHPYDMEGFAMQIPVIAVLRFGNHPITTILTTLSLLKVLARR